MEAITGLIQNSGFSGLTWQNLVMFAIGGVLIYLAIRKGFEPLLLIPIGFGAILANLPYAMMSASVEVGGGGGSVGHPLLQLVYDAGIRTEFLPPVIFLGVGALTDFRPLLGRPITFLLGAAAQLGIFVAALGAFYVFGFSITESAAIGIIGGAMVGYYQIGVSYAAYFREARETLVLLDVNSGLIKAVVFGIVIATVGCGCGLRAETSAEGVGKATKDSVVVSFILIIVFNYVITSVVRRFY